MPATKLGMKREVVTRFDTVTHNYVLSTAPRQENEIAATGVLFDHPYMLAAYGSDGVTVDTSFGASCTATVTKGTCTIGGTVTRPCVGGYYDFTDLKPASGTGQLEITFSAAGLTSYVSMTMTVVTPVYWSVQRAPGVWVQAELPRRTVNTAYPTLFGREYTLNPDLPPSSTNVQTWTAAIAKFAGDNGGIGYATDTRFTVSRRSYTETINLLPGPPNTGRCVFEPVGGIDVADGYRAKPSDFVTNPVEVKSANTLGVVQAAGAASHYLFGGIKVIPIFSGLSDIKSAIVNLHNGDLDDVTNTGTMYDQPNDIGFDRCLITGVPGQTALKGMILNARHWWVKDCCIDEVHATHSEAGGGAPGAIDTGGGDENAICCVGSVGPGIVQNTLLSGAGEDVLFGGGAPQFYDMRNRDILITRCKLYIPQSWRGRYKQKNNTEFKSADRVWFDACEFDGAWVDGQEGALLHISSANQSGGTPSEPYYTFEGTRNVAITNFFARNGTALLNMTAAITASSDDMHNVVVSNGVGVNINEAGTAAWLILYGGGFSQFLSSSPVQKLTVLAHPGSTAVGITFNSMSAVADSIIRDLIISAHDVGVNVAGDGFGLAGYASVMTDDPNPKGNVFVDFDASYPYNYAMPTDIGNFHPSLAGVGFTDVSGISSYATTLPETIVAGLKLSNASAIKGLASDGTDPGADIDTLLTKIRGVWDGTPAGGFLRSHRSIL